MRPGTIPLVDLKAQYASIKDEIGPAIARVLESTSFILGEEVAAFEREFATYLGAKHCVACANGTDALAIALQAIGVKPGDEVITASHTFIATAEAITEIGAKVVFVDVRADTLLLDVEQVERAIGPRTRAILAVHLYGQTVDMAPLLALARARGVKVVEDAAQAHGATYDGRAAGSLGDAAIFSFYPGKNLGAYGDAGAIVTNDTAAAQWAAKARNHGRATKYEHDFEGRNSRMDALQAAVLRVKLRHLDTWNRQRQALVTAYDHLLGSDARIRRVTIAAHCASANHLYVVRVAERDAVQRRLRDQGIEAGVHYPVPLHLQKAYSRLGMSAGSLPVTELAAGEILSLPLYPELELASVDRVAHALVDSLAVRPMD